LIDAALRVLESEDHQPVSGLYLKQGEHAQFADQFADTLEAAVVMSGIGWKL